MRKLIVVGIWVIGSCLIFWGAEYTKTHPYIKRAKGWETLDNAWRLLVASTTGMNFPVMIIILLTASLFILGTKK